MGEEGRAGKKRGGREGIEEGAGDSNRCFGGLTEACPG